VPTVIELVSIVDYSLSNPAINAAAFPSTPASYFWSATPVAGAHGSAWGVVFSAGYVTFGDVTDAGYVRCVRGG
jgi:hypothetical protein